MVRRVTIPVKGGLYKSVRVDTPAQSAGTTISGFDNQIITLDQLRAALGLNNKGAVTPPSGGGGSSSATLIPAPGLVGGGPLIGSVPLRINKQQAAAMFMSGEEEGGGSGPPGRKGPIGPIGANGAAGTPGGPRGFPIALVTEPDDPPTPIPVRGKQGPAGPQGPAGTGGSGGHMKIWLPENDHEERMFVYPKRSVVSSAVATTLAQAILADTPFAFWKCDDAATKLVDSSGNGFDLTTVNGTVAYQTSPLIPSLPTTLFARVGPLSSTGGNNGWQVTSQLGRTYPLLNWTAECVFMPLQSSATFYRILDLRPSGGGSAALTMGFTASTFQNFYPASANNLSVTVPVGVPLHVVITCSTTSGTSTVTQYVNGVLSGSFTASASALTGTMIMSVGEFGGNTSGNFCIGYIALFPATLAIARVAAHATAAGLIA